MTDTRSLGKRATDEMYRILEEALDDHEVEEVITVYQAIATNRLAGAVTRLANQLETQSGKPPMRARKHNG